MARKPHKYHYIYKTTCNVNGKYYIGMHSCSNLEDGYMGSGKRLRRSLNKHGIENHTKEILEFLEDRESLAKREFEIVNEELIQDPLCMNLQLGGGGGFSSEEHKLKFIKSLKKGNLTYIKRLKTDKEFAERVSERFSKISIGNQYGLGNKSFSGRSHSEETKEKMRNIDRTGSKNSQFGKCWITNGTENKKIKKDEQIPDGWKLGRKIK
jgi:hypothetical protein